MKIQAHLTRFARSGEAIKIRPIDISAHKDCPSNVVGPEGLNTVLNLAYMYGQNDFQPVDGCYSVSCGDVIQVTTDSGLDVFSRVMSFGFKRVSREEALSIIGMEAEQASWDR